MNPNDTQFGQDASTIVETILRHAIDNRASDIHFEPERDTLNIRFRVDGILYPVQTIRKMDQEEIISRIKVLSQMNITEHRFPQDGHFEFNYQNETYNIRVSTLPTLYGETIAFRILNRGDVLLRLDTLGLEKDQLDIINKLITTPSGMILITGPTGSGKTNFLYSILNTLNRPERKIITLEDPVEYQLPNIRQTQINEAIGMTFVKSLRSVVRQDPDVVMIGEIRDADTVQMAIQSALTGTFILSTFHTFDVPALVNRLIEMGATSSVIAQSIQAVVSTRLVRKNCSSCSQPYTPTDIERKLTGVNDPSVSFKRGNGCSICQNRGYLGRTGVFEIVYFDKEIKSAIIDKKGVLDFHQLIKDKKVKSLKESAVQKVIQGITTVEEVKRIIDLSSD